MSISDKLHEIRRFATEHEGHLRDLANDPEVSAEHAKMCIEGAEHWATMARAADAIIQMTES